MLGVLLINVGSPDAPDRRSVKRYLRQFLSDPYVIDLPGVVRWLLLNLVILPTRPKQSAEAYQKIWTDRGSPLLVHMRAIVDALAAKMPQVKVVMAMRYGQPDMEVAVKELQQAGCQQVTVLPLYPQYSTAATASAVDHANHLLAKLAPQIKRQVIHDFHQHPRFIQVHARLLQEQWSQCQADCLLLSYHGLPERQLEKLGCDVAQCTHQGMCDIHSDKINYCYRAQCYATSQAIVQPLGLSSSQYRVAFQSRLGKTPWIRPYSDECLSGLRQQGVKRLLVACPSFVADCLETLEEIDIRMRQQWQELGGEAFFMAPCLNQTPEWIEALRLICIDA